MALVYDQRGFWFDLITLLFFFLLVAFRLYWRFVNNPMQPLFALMTA